MSSSGASSAGRGLLFVVSAPSGAGKTTLVERLVEVTPGLRLSRSYTSRPARMGEVQGVDYNFISRERFQAMIDGREFLEWADVFGNFYGTGAADTERCLGTGEDLVLVIDVQGARQVRARGLASITIFLLPPSFDVLERRLRGRSNDPEPQIRRRLDVARQEVAAFCEYDYVVINEELESSVVRMGGIVLAERARLSVMRAAAERVVRTFEEPL